MSDQVGVHPADLIAHAAHIEAIGDQVATARQAGGAVRAGTGAYGQLCVMVPVMLGALQDVLLDGIGAAANSLHDTGSRLREAAGAYEVTDEKRAEVTDRIRDRL
jgi:hypothetical protein